MFHLLKLTKYYYYVLMCGLISCVVVVLGQLVGGLSPTTQVAGVLARGSAANWGGQLVPGALR